MGAIRILLADDHETVREGLKTILSGHPDFDIVADVDNGDLAVARARALCPDVVIMDLSLPIMNGLQATGAIVRSCPSTRVLVLTRHSDGASLQQLLRAGASGYVLKQSRATVLVDAIRAIASGDKYLDPAVTGKVIGGFNRHGVPAAPVPPAPAISDREEQVLRLVAWGFSNKEIAARLELSVKTIETHKANAMQKLEIRSRAELVRFALAQGWMANQ
jgi:two-component system, NarL family, response regulator NreC